MMNTESVAEEVEHSSAHSYVADTPADEARGWTWGSRSQASFAASVAVESVGAAFAELPWGNSSVGYLRPGHTNTAYRTSLLRGV